MIFLLFQPFLVLFASLLAARNSPTKDFKKCTRKKFLNNFYTRSLFCLINFPLKAVESKRIGSRIINLVLNVMIVKCSIEMAKNFF